MKRLVFVFSLFALCIVVAVGVGLNRSGSDPVTNMDVSLVAHVKLDDPEAEKYYAEAQKHADATDFASALHWLEKALEVLEPKLGTQHQSTALTHKRIGEMHYMLGNFDKAIPHFEKALSWYDESAKSAADVYFKIITLRQMADAYHFRHDNAIAAEVYLKALVAAHDNGYGEHPSSRVLYLHTAQTFSELGFADRAVLPYLAAYLINAKFLGKGHYETQAVLTALRENHSKTSRRDEPFDAWLTAAVDATKYGKNK